MQSSSTFLTRADFSALYLTPNLLTGTSALILHKVATLIVMGSYGLKFNDRPCAMGTTGFLYALDGGGGVGG